ncbi:MAG: bacteriohemerythrin [Treponema sp.]|nr:bacteriohemerythrin [Treponema sp.]
MNEDSVVWNDAYSVGFEPIDTQHKELVKMTNELFESCKQGTDAADKAFLQTIKRAAEYARNHFSDEDKYMLEANFPNLNDHRKLHDDFLAVVGKAIQDFNTGSTEPFELAQFLKNWLLTHIAEADKQYAPYLAKLKD